MVHAPPPSPGADWLVQVPLSQLVALQTLLPEVEKLRAENKALSNRLDGLHRTLYDTMEMVADLRRSLSVPVRRSA